MRFTLFFWQEEPSSPLRDFSQLLSIMFPLEILHSNSTHLHFYINNVAFTCAVSSKDLRPLFKKEKLTFTSLKKFAEMAKHMMKVFLNFLDKTSYLLNVK